MQDLSADAFVFMVTGAQNERV